MIVLLFVALCAIHHLDYYLNDICGIQATVIGHHQRCTPALNTERSRPHLQDTDEAQHDDLLLIGILEGDTSEQELLEDVIQKACLEVGKNL